MSVKSGSRERIALTARLAEIRPAENALKIVPYSIAPPPSATATHMGTITRQGPLANS